HVRADLEADVDPQHLADQNGKAMLKHRLESPGCGFQFVLAGHEVRERETPIGPACGLGEVLLLDVGKRQFRAGNDASGSVGYGAADTTVLTLPQQKESYWKQSEDSRSP